MSEHSFAVGAVAPPHISAWQHTFRIRHARRSQFFHRRSASTGQCWIWGSECNFKGDTVERVGNQVHYISLLVGNQTFAVNTYYPNEQNWTLEEIDNAFQMDLDSAGDPYNVWLDKVNVTAY